MEMSVIRVSLSILLFSISPVSCASESGLPTRQECIVKIISKAPDLTRFRTGGLMELMPIASRQNLPLAGLKVVDEATVYLQYGSKCQERFSMSEKLFSEAFPKHAFRIDHEVVHPGPKTINMVGREWRDGEANWLPSTHK